MSGLEIEFAARPRESLLEASAPGERALAGWEIGSVVSSVLVAEWAGLALAEWRMFALVVPATLACALIVASQWLRGETRRELGLGRAHFGRALKLLALPMLLGTLLLFIMGRGWYGAPVVFNWQRAGWMFWGLPVWGLLWGLVQQYALQAFINRRLQTLWGAGWQTTLVVALIFALLHLPNPGLMAATFLGGLLWATVYQRAPNLWALALSHAVMTFVLISTLPPALLGSLRVGYRYFG